MHTCNRAGTRERNLFDSYDFSQYLWYTNIPHNIVLFEFISCTLRAWMNYDLELGPAVSNRSNRSRIDIYRYWDSGVHVLMYISRIIRALEWRGEHWSVGNVFRCPWSVEAKVLYMLSVLSFLVQTVKYIHTYVFKWWRSCARGRRHRGAERRKNQQWNALVLYYTDVHT